MAQETEWNAGMTQEEYMAADLCITLDHDDNMLKGVDKKTCHVFSKSTPRGVLHRAFSVFLFDQKGRLLLQKRASHKITFPGVWTNTCCSHPLHVASEMDDVASVQAGTTMGAKCAAIRKLKQELGIEPGTVPIEKFKFLTRLHYWAADTVTHGPKSPWGEHEIDYILFAQVDDIDEAGVRATINAEEVEDVRLVTQTELHDMMKQPGLIWSPWFRIIVERFLVYWWKDLNITFNTNVHVNVDTIYRFDPPKAHQGGAGDAGLPWLDKPANQPKPRRSLFSASKKTRKKQSSTKKPGSITATKAVQKQGSYGKVQIHKHSKLSQLMRVDEVAAALRVKLFNPFEEKVKMESESELYCKKVLFKVSRSFAAVIMQLPDSLCREVMIFYLVLRALDTVEDDMVAFKGREEIKLTHLRTFYKTALTDENWYSSLNEDNWNMNGVGEGDEADLLQHFHHVVRVFKSFTPGMQAVIADITKRMGEGMAEFVDKDLGQGTTTVAEFDKYCHYVAGLVGIGLSQMFSESDLEVAMVGERVDLSNSMGLFLQKTNIIRDYLEDYVDKRAFWPQEIWKTHTKSQELGEFAKNPTGPAALGCLNELVTNALSHALDCLTYLEQLKNPNIFKFCAIPQVMAIATLAECYNNTDVFTGVVKIRKGMACKMMLGAANMHEVRQIFAQFARQIAEVSRRVDSPLSKRTQDACEAIVNKTGVLTAPPSVLSSVAPLLVGVTVASAYVINQTA